MRDEKEKERKGWTDRQRPTREGERAAAVLRLRSSIVWVRELANAGSILYTRREGRSAGMMEGSRRRQRKVERRVERR